MPFQMRNPADPDHPQVVLPAKYLSELKSAPESRFSFRLYSEQVGPGVPVASKT